LAGAGRRQSGTQAGGAHDRGHAALDLGRLRDLVERRSAGEQTGPRGRPADEGAQLRGRALVGERRVVRLPGAHLLREPPGVAVRGDRHQAEPVAMPREHVEGALAHRAGRAEYGDADHRTTPSSVSPSSSTGAAPVRLSMRSMTPPCPGNTRPLSFTPAKRFSRLSVRSPMIEKATAVRHSGRNAASGTWNHRLPATATSALSATPPNTPSQVLPGDTSGARRTRPKRRPKKNAPM